MSRLETSALPTRATRALRASSSGGDGPQSGDTPLPQSSGQSSFDSLPVVCKADIARDDLTGLRLGHYALGKKIGVGGMGKVFYARHLHLDRVLAIKFMAIEVCGSTEAHHRFERETLALGRLQHPQIVNAVDAGCVGGLKFLVTELIEGEDLAVRVQKHGKLSYPVACELIRQVAVGLAYSHDSGFVHRDIKPSNLIVDQSGTVKILDFGLVQDGQRDLQLTGNSEMLGTWDFLAPEQAHDASEVDHRGDLYSLGCTLLYLLSGQVPFDGERYASPAAKLKGHLLDVPAWLQAPPANVPHTLVGILARMVAKSPKDRFHSAHDVVAALSPFTSQQQQAPKAWKPTAAAERASSFRRYGRAAAIGLSLLIVIKMGLVVSCVRPGLGISPIGIKLAEPSSTHEVSVNQPATSQQIEKPPVAGQQTSKEQPAAEQIAGAPVEIHPFAASPDLLLPKTSRRITVDSNQTNNASPVVFPSGGQSGQSFRRKWKTH